MVIEVSIHPHGKNKPVIHTSGREVRQASWADVDKFTDKKGCEGHLDLIELCNWRTKNEICKKAKGRSWRPANCWLLDEGGCRLFKNQKWAPVRLVLEPVRTEILENTLKPVSLDEFSMSNESGTEATFQAKGQRSITSSVSKSKFTGHSIGASVSTKVGCEIAGLGASSSVCITGSYEHSWGKEWKEEKTASTSAIASVSFMLKPGQRKHVTISGKEGTIRVRVYYKAYLTGGMAADHPKKFDGDHHFWYYAIGDVLKHNNVKNNAELYEDYCLTYYSEISTTLKD